MTSSGFSSSACTGALLPRVRLGKFGPTNNPIGHSNQNGVFKVYAWGSGKDGRCGNGKESSEKVPVPVETQYKFTSLSCGYHHSAAVSQEGMVLTWGRGVFGQLGHGDTENYSIPTPVESLIKIHIIQVACGWQHSVAVNA